jgi:hypothetical protein
MNTLGERLTVPWLLFVVVRELLKVLKVKNNEIQMRRSQKRIFRVGLLSENGGT